MSRIGQIRKEAEKIYEERFKESCIGIQKELEMQWDILENEIVGIIGQLMADANEMNRKGVKGIGKYLIISHLYSSFLAGSYEYRIDILDEDMYMDIQECSAYWTPSILIPYIEKDYEYLKKVMREKFIRLREYEIKEIERNYQFYYHSLVYEIFLNIKKSTALFENYKLLYGEYMGGAIMV
ncbi:MAG: hypothetical protein NC118_03490 [Eubacterium sp.]|nr:hypothetical protein [Eubacterium sp.]